MKPQDLNRKLKQFIKEPTRLRTSLQFHMGRTLYPRYKQPLILLFRYTTALGDALMLTTLAHEIRLRNPQAIIHVVTGLPQIFTHNPDVNFVSPDPNQPMIGLGRHLIRYEHRFPWTRHLLYYCAECVDIHDKIALKTYIYPTTADYEWAQNIVHQLGARPILINRMAGPRTNKKNWPYPYWKTLIPCLLELAPVIDIGTGEAIINEHQPSNWLNLLNKTTIHQLAALMSYSCLLIGPVSGPLHLASAVNLPTISLVGGSEPAIATQYPNCVSLANQPACHNCYEQGPCGFDFQCLWAIKPESVLQAVTQQLSK